MTNEKPQIILASASIGRKGLLKKLGVPFDVIISDIDEDSITNSNPIEMLQKRASAKAKSVLQTLTSNFELRSMNYLVIAADSEAILDGKTYGKSKSRSHTKEMLRELMGKTHTFTTATTILYLKSNKEIDRWERRTETFVTMRSMSEAELDHYIQKYDFTRFAAAYTLNETPWDLITKIDGSYTNVIGLPFEVVLPIFYTLKIL